MRVTFQYMEFNIQLLFMLLLKWFVIAIESLRVIETKYLFQSEVQNYLLEVIDAFIRCIQKE